MKHYSKQFTGWVTNLKRNPFEQARLKLTGYYLFIMVLIMGIFSFALIGVLENNIKASLQKIEDSSRIRHEVLLETRDEVEGAIFIIDGILLIIIGGMSYFLAGKTLLPIKKNFEMQRRFTADASHDLRTPLTVMKTEMEVALQSNHEDSEKYKKVLHSGLEEIQTMSLLIEDLLALARSENIYKKEECERINYSTCISSLLEL
jgi:signal transduction histidine kinase